MNRTLKFRAWDKINKEMTLPVLIPKREGGGYAVAGDGHRYEVMQDTGLRDKNDRDIFVGDVLEDPFGVRQEAVEFVDDKYALSGFRFRRIKSKDDLAGGWEVTEQSWLQVAEIIGNIYENPDLLPKEATS